MTYIRHDLLIPEVVSLYETGLPPGSSTGWLTLDKHYTVPMHQWTLITGYPHSGKSEWLDALLVNLADKEPWRFSIFSPENHPLSIHCAKILEKRIGKPFGVGPTERMTPDERDAGMEWMKGKFFFMKFEEPHLFSILAEAAQMPSTGNKYKHGVVIDPWNTLEFRRQRDMTTTEFVSQQLTEIVRFTRENYAHCWLVAHPRKPDKDSVGKAPRPSDVSDSMHFYNKADFCIAIHRNQLEESQQVEIHIQKARQKHSGRIGMVTLHYDRVTGRYHEKTVDHTIANYYAGKLSSSHPRG